MHVSNNLNKQTIDYELPDDWSMNKVTQAMMDVPVWLRTCQQALTKAIKYSAKTLVNDAALSTPFRYILHAYFRVPLYGPDTEGDCRRVVNRIIPKLLQTHHGLCLERVEIADWSQMPGIAMAQWKCMGMVGALLQQSPKELAGVVFESFFESGMRAISETFSPRDFFSPKEGRINVNFDLLWQIEARAKNPLYSVKTLMHEATHKFAHALDKHYFPAASIYETFSNNLDLLVMAQDGSKTFDKLVEDAWKSATKLPAIKDSVAATAKISRDDLLENADGIASYALDVASLSTEIKEMKQAIKAIMGVKPKPK